MAAYARIYLPMSERFPLVSFGLHFQQPKATILHISCCLSRYSFASRSKISRDALLTNNIPSPFRHSTISNHFPAS